MNYRIKNRQYVRSGTTVWLLMLAFSGFLSVNKALAQTDGGIETITIARLTGITATGNSQPLVFNATAPLTYSTAPQEQTKYYSEYNNIKPH